MELNNIKFSIEGIDSCGYEYKGETDECFMFVHYIDGTNICIPISSYEEYHKWSIKIYECMRQKENK